MNSFKLALFNVKNNIKLFKFNIISMVVSIAVFFNFFSLMFNPSLDLENTDRLAIKVTLFMTSILLIFFIVFFVLYSNAFFLKQRKKEIGIYTFMGVDNSKIALVFAVEEIILGVLSLVFGLLFGMIFQKAFLMLLTKTAEFKTEVTFYLSIKAVIISSIVFIAIFSLAAFIGFRSIIKSKLIDLLNSEKQEDKALKTRYFTGFMSNVLIVIGYYFSRKIFQGEFFTNCIIVMFCIIAGTFLLFSSFLSIVIKFMINKKKILYNGTNIVSISNIAYRIRYNYRTLACITIVVAATITSIATAFTIPYMFKNLIRVTYPYSFSYTSSNGALKQKVLSAISKSGHKVNLDIDIKYLPFDSQRGSQYPKNHPVIRLSDFNKMVNRLKASDNYTVIEYARKLRDGMAISAVSANDTGFSDNQAVNMYGLNIKVIKTMNTPLLGGIFENNTIILTDNDYNKFKDYCDRLPVPQKEKSFLGIIVSNQNDSLELSKQLRAIEGFEGFSTYVEYYNAYNEETGVVKFTGMFLGFVFMLSTASIMYMKIMSDAIGDKKKYEILMRLGMNKSEIYRAVSKQVGLSYALPLVIGAIYAFMAIDALQIFLDKYIKMSLIQPFLFGLLIYVIVYIAFYLLTTRKFVDLVEG